MKTLKTRVILPTLLATVGAAYAAPPAGTQQADSLLVPVPMIRAQNSVQLNELPALLDDFGPEGAQIETIPLEEIVPATCFDPDNPPPPEVIAAFNAAMQGYESRYNIQNRWSGTAGNPVNLTWSFVPDGLQISAGVSGESPGPSVLFAQMDAKFGGIANRNVWINVFQQSFNRWQQISGVNYTRVTAAGVPWDDGAAWGSFSSATRGVIRIAGKNIDGAGGVLAYNYYPSTTNGIGGEMVMDTSENWGSTTNNYRFMRNVVTHELGHGLGFAHVCPANATKLMEPFLSTAYDGPRHDDLRASTFNYGDRFEPNNSSGAATAIATTTAGATIIPGTVPTPAIPNGSLLSLSNSADEDWFRSSVTAPRLANIVVSPAGLTYDSSTQSGGSCNSGNNVNSLNFANLAMEIRASNGTTVWRSANATGLGGTETINGVLLSPPGNYFVRVYSTNTFSQSQLYNLTISSVTTPTLTASQGTSTTAVNLSWTAVNSATEYALFRGTTNSRAAASFLVAVSPALTTWADSTAVAGTTYFYWVEAQQGAGGRRPLAGPNSGFRANPAPSNNNCANAIPLSLGVAYDGSNVNATTQGVASCRVTNSGRDVWHTFTPTCTGTYRIDTCNSQFDVVLSVHSACVGSSANTLFCQDDGGQGGAANCPNALHPAMNVFLNSGTTYIIRVAGFGTTSPAQGAYRILVSSVTPSNDLCANATPVSDGDYPVSNCTATTDFLATNACVPSTQGHNDVWYRYTASCEGNITIETCDTNYDTVLMVYPANTCPVAATVPLACNDDTSGCGLLGIRGSRVVFPAVPGQQFLVRVAGWATSSRGGGNISFTCRPDCSPCAADYNQDGGVDGADVDAFFSDWEQGLPCADVNEDGGIDGSDVDFFFNVWENGGC